MSNCRPKCNSCECGEPKCPTKCDTYASNVIYDCGDLPEICIKSGASMCTVIQNIVKVLRGVMNGTAVIQKESFMGTSDVVLSSKPLEILMVTYCGAILPSNYYRAYSNGQVKFVSTFCQDDDADVQVIYKTEYDASTDLPCFS